MSKLKSLAKHTHNYTLWVLGCAAFVLLLYSTSMAEAIAIYAVAAFVLAVHEFAGLLYRWSTKGKPIESDVVVFWIVLLTVSALIWPMMLLLAFMAWLDGGDQPATKTETTGTPVSQ